MPENVSRFAAVLYDQFEEEDDRVADWGGDELFTRMPSRPRIDDAPPPRFRPALTLVESPAERPRDPGSDRGAAVGHPDPLGDGGGARGRAAGRDWGAAGGHPPPPRGRVGAGGRAAG